MKTSIMPTYGSALQEGTRLIREKLKKIVRDPEYDKWKIIRHRCVCECDRKRSCIRLCLQGWEYHPGYSNAFAVYELVIICKKCFLRMEKDKI